MTGCFEALILMYVQCIISSYKYIFSSQLRGGEKLRLQCPCFRCTVRGCACLDYIRLLWLVVAVVRFSAPLLGKYVLDSCRKCPLLVVHGLMCRDSFSIHFCVFALYERNGCSSCIKVCMISWCNVERGSNKIFTPMCVVCTIVLVTLNLADCLRINIKFVPPH